MCRGGLSEEQKQTLTHCRLKHREQDTRDYGEKGKQKTKKREGVRQHLGGTNREHTAEGTKGMGIRGGGGRTQTPDICRLWEKESKIKQEVSETEKRKYTRIKGTIAPPLVGGQIYGTRKENELAQAFVGAGTSNLLI